MALNKISKNMLEKSFVDEVDAINQQVESANQQLADKAGLSYVDAKVASLVSGSPKGIYATFSALQTAFPSGNTNIYVVTADGKWYYWNGSAWTAGGIYQSTGIADKSVKFSSISDKMLKEYNGFQTKITNSTAHYLWLTKPTTKALTVGDVITMSFKFQSKNKDVTKMVAYIYKSNLSSVSSKIGINPSTDGEEYAFTYNYTVPAGFEHQTGDNLNVLYGIETTSNTSEFYIYDAKITFNDATYVNFDFLPIKTYQSHVNQGITPIINSFQYSPYGFVTRENEKKPLEKTPTLKNKKMVFMGDSLTNNIGTYTAKAYFDYIKEWFSTTNTVDGQNGTRIRDDGVDTARAMSIRYTNLSNDADIVVVWGGTNDAQSATNGTLGIFGDTSPTTLYGAMKTLCDGLLTKYPDKLIIFMLPYKNNAIANRPVLEAMIKVLQDHSIPYLDLYAMGGINPNNAAQKAKYLLEDNVHLNAKGHELVANRLVGFINSLIKD